jgi:hypothetical protein
MANFPIEYSQGQLSGGGGAPRARIGSPVGQLSLARATGDLGNTLFDISQKAEKAEAAMELSGLQRQYEEAEATMLDTISKMDDEEARQKFYEKWKQDTPAGLVSKRDLVNQSMKIYLDRQAPQTDKLYQSLNTTLKIKSAMDKWEFNALKNLEAGNFEAYSRDAKIAFDAGLMGPEEYKTRIENFPIESTFAQARILMDKDPQKALAMLEGLDNLTGPQLDKRDKLMKYGSELRAAKADAVIDQVQRAIRKPNKSPEDIAQIEQMIESIPADEETQYRWFARLDASLSDKKIVTNYAEKTRLREMAKRVGIGATTKKQVMDEVFASREKASIDDSDVDELMSLAETEREQYLQSFSGDADAAAKSQLVDSQYREITIYEALLAGIMSGAGKEGGMTLKEAQAEVERHEKKRQIQMWNYDRYQQRMEALLRKNPDISSEEYRRESKRAYRELAKDEKTLASEWEIEGNAISTVEPDNKLAEEIKTAYPKAYFQDGYWLVDVNGVPMRIQKK